MRKPQGDRAAAAVHGPWSRRYAATHSRGARARARHSLRCTRGARSFAAAVFAVSCRLSAVSAGPRSHAAARAVPAACAQPRS
jgi:hypothetical protein